jgi:hypothetical protein
MFLMRLSSGELLLRDGETFTYQIIQRWDTRNGSIITIIITTTTIIIITTTTIIIIIIISSSSIDES